MTIMAIALGIAVYSLIGWLAAYRWAKAESWLRYGDTGTTVLCIALNVHLWPVLLPLHWQHTRKSEKWVAEKRREDEDRLWHATGGQAGRPLDSRKAAGGCRTEERPER